MSNNSLEVWHETKKQIAGVVEHRLEIIDKQLIQLESDDIKNQLAIEYKRGQQSELKKLHNYIINRMSYSNINNN